MADGVGAAGAGLLLVCCWSAAGLLLVCWWCGWCVAAGVPGVAAGVAIVRNKSKINFALQNEGLNICLLNYFAPNEICTVF